MSEHRPPKPVTTAQIVGVLCSTLALFFIVAFASKSLDAYRLRKWRDSLTADIADMVREREELREEARRRQSVAWAEEVLRDAGQVSDDQVSVVAATFTPHPVASPMVRATPTVAPGPAHEEALFQGEHWRAWQRLIWGFD